MLSVDKTTICIEISDAVRYIYEENDLYEFTTISANELNLKLTNNDLRLKCVGVEPTLAPTSDVSSARNGCGESLPETRS